MLDQGDLLTVPQAARVGRDVASALEYAHARGVLHRDIKPANLLFDEHGIVRVADFGLARALAEASWTEPAGAVFGTARYASPEQANGMQLDARSDLYSLGAGARRSGDRPHPVRVRHHNRHADGTDAAAAHRARRARAARAGRSTAPARSILPTAIPTRPRCARRSPTRPTRSRRPGPLLLAGMIDRADPHPTRAVPDRTAPLFDQDAADIVVVPDTAPVEAVVAFEPDTKESRREQRRRTGQRRLVPFVVALVVIITIAIAAAALAQVRGDKAIQVPGLRGMQLSAAEAAARKAGVTLDKPTARNAPEPFGTVVSQNPTGRDLHDQPPCRARGVGGTGQGRAARYLRQAVERRASAARRGRGPLSEPAAAAVRLPCAAGRGRFRVTRAGHTRRARLDGAGRRRARVAHRWRCRT